MEYFVDCKEGNSFDDSIKTPPKKKLLGSAEKPPITGYQNRFAMSTSGLKSTKWYFHFKKRGANRYSTFVWLHFTNTKNLSMISMKYWTLLFFSTSSHPLYPLQPTIINLLITLSFQPIINQLIYCQQHKIIRLFIFPLPRPISDDAPQPLVDVACEGCPQWSLVPVFELLIGFCCYGKILHGWVPNGWLVVMVVV